MMVLRTGMVYTGMLRMCVIKEAWGCAWCCEEKPDKEHQAKNCLPVFSAVTLPSYLPFPEWSFIQILPQALLSFQIALRSLPCWAGRKRDTLGSGIRQSWAQILVSSLMSWPFPLWLPAFIGKLEINTQVYLIIWTLCLQTPAIQMWEQNRFGCVLNKFLAIWTLATRPRNSGTK